MIYIEYTYLYPVSIAKRRSQAHSMCIVESGYAESVIQKLMAKKNKGGRPTIMTAETLSKLEHAFSLGCTDVEACIFADIGQTTLYEYQEKHPEFAERKAELKETPILKARMTVVDKLGESYVYAMDYLKRKKRNEFGDSVDHTSGGDKIQPVLVRFVGDDTTTT